MKFRVIWKEPEEDKGAVSVMPRSSIIDEGNTVVGQEVTCKWRKMRYRAVIDSIIDKKRAATSDIIGDAMGVLFGENSGPPTDLEGQSPQRQSDSLKLTEQMEKIFQETERMSREADRMAKEADRMAHEADRLAKEADRVTEGLQRLEKLSERITSESEKMTKRGEGMEEKVDAMFHMLEGLVDVIQRRASRVPPTTPPSAAPFRCVTNTTPPPVQPPTAKKRCPVAKQNENSEVFIGDEDQLELPYSSYMSIYEKSKEGSDFAIRLFEHFYPGDELKNYNYFGNVEGKRALVESKEFGPIIQQTEKEFPGFRSSTEKDRLFRNKLNNKCRKIAFCAARNGTV